jgi:hypothetical protein
LEGRNEKRARAESDAMQAAWCARLRATKGRRNRRTQEPKERTNERASRKSERNSTRKRSENRTKFEPKSSQNQAEIVREAFGTLRGDPGGARGGPGTRRRAPRDPFGTFRGAPGAPRGGPGAARGVPRTSRDAPETRRTAFGAPFLRRSRPHPFSRRFSDEFLRFPRRARDGRHAFCIGFYSIKRMSGLFRCTIARAAETHEKGSKNDPEITPKSLRRPPRALRRPPRATGRAPFSAGRAIFGEAERAQEERAQRERFGGAVGTPEAPNTPGALLVT